MTPTKLLSLDLGSGKKPAEGFIGVDLFCGTMDPPSWSTVSSMYTDEWWAEREPGEVVPIDLFRLPWPIATDSVREVHCSHFVEHLPPPRWQPNELGNGGRMIYPSIDWMEELWRVCVHNAKVTIIHPSLQSVRAFQDPTHTDFIPPQRWAYYDPRWRQANGLDHRPYPQCNFQTVEVQGSYMVDTMELRSTEFQEQAATWYWNVTADLLITLRCVKEDEPEPEPVLHTDAEVDGEVLRDRWSTGA